MLKPCRSISIRRRCFKWPERGRGALEVVVKEAEEVELRDRRAGEL
jgi:hypothetical protein